MADIKLICFDLDGTILEKGTIITDNAQEILEEAILCGAKISTASGRSIIDQLQILENSNLGHSKGWPHALITDESSIYILDGENYNPLSEWNEMVNRVWRKNLTIVRRIILEDLERLRENGVSVQNLIASEEVERRNLIGLLFSNIEDALTYEKELSIRLSEEDMDGEVQCNRNWYFVQILPRMSGKGNTVFTLANYFGLKPEEVLVIGDSGNDLNMLDSDYGFYAATVSNAEPAVKRVVAKRGGYIASHKISRGVIEIVREVVLKERELIDTINYLDINEKNWLAWI
ncbi:MAG TPA: HAD family hydrolase [bacterium]|nr:HAD family hydrolase [bacterium]